MTKKTNKIDQPLMLTVLVWLYLPTGEVAHSSGKKNCSLLASCQLLLLSNMKKMKKKNLRFARRTRAFCQVWLKKKNHTKRICESKQKSWKKKVSASRFMLAPSAKFEIKKKGSKIAVWERRGCLFLRLAHCAACVVTASRWNRIE